MVGERDWWDCGSDDADGFGVGTGGDQSGGAGAACGGCSDSRGGLVFMAARFVEGARLEPVADGIDSPTRTGTPDFPAGFDPGSAEWICGNLEYHLCGDDCGAVFRGSG